MKKSVFIDFINRYYLGKVESVSWKFDGKSIKTGFRSIDKHMMGIISKQNFDDFDGGDKEIGILTTSKLLKIVNVMDDVFDINFKSINNGVEEKIHSMIFSDNKTVASNTLADLSVIPKAKGLKKEPDYNVTLKISKDFIDLFIKAKNALPDSKSFTLVKNDDSTYSVVIGYSSTNTDRIYIPIELHQEIAEYDKLVSFSSHYFKEILSVNKNASDIYLNVSYQGVSHIDIVDGDYKIDYYLAQVQPDI